MFAQPVLRPLNPSFGFVAASLTMSEKVEATVSKVCIGAARKHDETYTPAYLSSLQVLRRESCLPVLAFDCQC